MYIHQATKKAVKENKMMYRKNVMQIHGKIIIGILPTDSYVTCLIAKIKDGKVVDIMSHWNPTRDYLVAKDWELMDRPLQKEWPEDKLNRFEIFNT